MNSNPQGPKKNKKFTKKAKRQNSTSLSIPTTKKSDGQLPTNKKSKKYVATTLKRQTTKPPRFSKKNEQGNTKSMAQVFDSRTRNSTRRDTGSSHNYTSSRRDEGASSNSGYHKSSSSNSDYHKSSYSNSGHHKSSYSHSDYHKNASSNSGYHKNASSNSDYHKNHLQQRPHSYSSNPWQSQPGYNGYVDSSWDYNGYANSGYDQQWGFDQPHHPLNHLTQNHFRTNKWRSKEQPENGSSHPATSYGKGSHHRSPSSSRGSLNQSPSSRSKFVPRPKRPLQSIEEIKRQKEEAAKVAKRNKEEAARVALEMRKEEEIAATKSRLVASLKAQENQGHKVKFTFSPGHWSPSSKEEERDRPQQELNDFNLTAGDLAQIGLGADVAVPLLEDDPPPVLPVYVNCLATAPVTTEGQVQERPRVAYTRSSPSTSSISDGEEGPSKAKTSFNNPKVPKSRTAFRSRTVSESNKRVGFAGKRSRKTSEQNSRSLELPETRAEKDVYDIGKFKQALLKMNKRELSELVNTPTSTKSKILMSALVRDHKRLISQRLNQVRFNCTSKMLVSMGENLDNADSLLEVELPPELLVHISDIIKMEVPDVEIVAEKLCINPVYPASSAIKQELSAGHSLLEKVKEEVEEMPNAVADEVIEVPVPPKPTPPLVDLEASEEIRAGNNAVEITQDTISLKKNTKFHGTNSKAKDNASKAKDNATKAKDNATKAKDKGILAEEPSDLVPFEGLRREPRKRGRPKNGEVRRNLGQEIVIGTIGTIDSSENDSSHDSEDSPTTNKKAKFQEEQKDKTNRNVEQKDETNGNVEQSMASIPAEEGPNNNLRNLGLIFEQESKLWSELKANREEIDELQKKENDLLDKLDFMNELKKQMFKS